MNFSYSQTINSAAYPFTSSSGVSLEDMTGGTQLLGSNLDDNASPVTNLGFTFYFVGIPYTQFSVNANGLCRLGSTAVTSSYTNDLASTSNSPQIAAYWDDLFIGTNGQVWYKLIGSAPNRKLVVEWQNMQIPRTSSGNAGAGNFQLWLFESTGVIEFVYGSGININAANSGYSVGFGTTAALIASVTTASSTCAYGTAMNSQTGAISSGTAFIFTPNVISGSVTNLNFPIVGSASINLNFTDNAVNETNFLLYKSSDNITFTYLASITTTTSAGTGSTYEYNVTGLIPSTAYYFKVVAVTEGSSSTELTGTQTTNPPGNIVSAQTGNWSSTTTWIGGVVPTQYDNVSVEAGTIVTIDAAATCLNLTVSGTLQFEAVTARIFTVTGNVTINSEAFMQSAASGSITSHVLSIAGDLLNDGTINFSTSSNSAGAQIRFTGSTSTVWINGPSSSTNLRNTSGVTINKGTNITSTLTFTPGGTFTVQGANALGFLTLTNGLFILDGTNPISNPVFNTAAYSIPSSAGFQLNNNNATIIGLSGSPTLTGTLKISKGVYNIGTTNNSMGFASGATVIIDSGTVNAVARFGVASAGNMLNYTQTGGTVNVNTIKGNTSSSLYSFDAGTSTLTRFNMSGGTVVVFRDSTSYQSALRGPAVGSIVNISGGLFQVGSTSTPPSTTFRITGNMPSLSVNSTNNPNVTMGGPVIIRGDLTLNGTGTFTNNFSSITLTGNSESYPGNFTINAGSILTANASSTQTYTFNSSFGNQQFINNGTITGSLLPSIIIANTFPSGTVTLPAITIMGGATLTLTSGTLLGNLTFGQGNSSNFTVNRTNGFYGGTPTFNFGTGTVNYQYYQSSSQITAGNELPAVVDNFTLNNTSGLILNSPLHVKGSLSLTAGNINLGANTLTLGSSTASLGVVSFTNTAAGASITGALKRWVNTSTGTSISFPVGVSGIQRNALINFSSAPAAGGTITTEWVSAPSGVSGLPLTEGAININTTSEVGFWRITPGDGFSIGTGAYTLTLNGNNLSGVADFASLVQLKRTDAASPWTLSGTHVTTTGSNASPVLSRTLNIESFGEFAVGSNDLNNPLPVELSSLTAKDFNRNVVINWITKSESNTNNFVIQRKTGEDIWYAVSSVKANGNSNVENKYSYTDSKLNAGKYNYRLKMVDNDGQYTYSSVIEVEIDLPRNYSLSQNYPNPFNPSTRIDYQLASDSRVTIELYNISGEIVAEIINKNQSAGYYTVDVNSSLINKSLTSGVYFYRMSAIDETNGNTFVSVKKMIIIK